MVAGNDENTIVELTEAEIVDVHEDEEVDINTDPIEKPILEFNENVRSFLMRNADLELPREIKGIRSIITLLHRKLKQEKNKGSG